MVFKSLLARKSRDRLRRERPRRKLRSLIYVERVIPRVTPRSQSLFLNNTFHTISRDKCDVCKSRIHRNTIHTPMRFPFLLAARRVTPP